MKVIGFFLVLTAIVGGAYLSSINSKTMEVGNIADENIIKGLEEEALNLENIKIPDRVKVLGLGEYSHGNSKPQQFRFELGKKLVNEGFKNFLFEMP